jgi:hypothetical protein
VPGLVWNLAYSYVYICQRGLGVFMRDLLCSSLGNFKSRYLLCIMGAIFLVCGVLITNEKLQITYIIYASF